MYRRLDPSKIIETMGQLRDRVQARFPDSSLGEMAADLENIAKVTAVRTAAIRKPNLGLRIGIVVIVMTIPLLLLVKLQAMEVSLGDNWPEFIQTLEAGLSGTVWKACCKVGA